MVSNNSCIVAVSSYHTHIKFCQLIFLCFICQENAWVLNFAGHYFCGHGLLVWHSRTSFWQGVVDLMISTHTMNHT